MSLRVWFKIIVRLTFTARTFGRMSGSYIPKIRSFR